MAPPAASSATGVVGKAALASSQLSKGGSAPSAMSSFTPGISGATCLAISATPEEATWVLTSYLVSNAIVLPMTGWLGNYFGRRRLFLLCVALFTFASVLCGMATSLAFLIVARILQGLGGGAMVPIAQAILLESFPVAKRGAAMAAFSMGIIVAPILGPTLGGWITDNYSWRWIFYINVPVGILAFVMAEELVEDPPYIRRNKHATVDFAGFALLAIWLGTLQIVLDKGQEMDWFQSAWICWLAAISVVSRGSKLTVRTSKSWPRLKVSAFIEPTSPCSSSLHSMGHW